MNSPPDRDSAARTLDAGETEESATPGRWPLLAVGDVIGSRFRIEAFLGAGASGAVYRATQLGLSREVALKVLHAHLCADSRGRARFEREARVANALAHPHAVRVYDFGEDEQRVFLAMELVEGRTLRQRLTDNPDGLDLTEAIEVTWQIADVLTAAHQLPLVHRDLKPENVFVETAASALRVRVVDFGLAFVSGGAPTDRMTALGIVAGTPSYLSPEQARGDVVTPATDIYALGSMFYELVSGRTPFVGVPMDVLTKQMFAPPQPLRRRREGASVPTAVHELIMAMLVKDPHARPDARAVRAMLSAIDPVRSHERARDLRSLLSREGRMVGEASRPNLPTEQKTETPTVGESLQGRDDAARELWIGAAVSPDLLLGLAANGIAAVVISATQPLPAEAIVLASEASPDEVARLLTRGAYVIATLDLSDMARLTELLRAGAFEVVPTAPSVAEVVRAFERAHRRRTRRPPRGQQGGEQSDPQSGSGSSRPT